MKQGRKFRLWALMMVLVLLLTGCNSAQKIVEQLDDPQVRQMTETMLDSILSEDFDTAWPLVEAAIERTAFEGGFSELCRMLSDVESYELQANHITKNVAGNGSNMTIRYLMTAGDVRFWVDVTTMEGVSGLTGFFITPVTTETGLIGKMEEATAAQWVVLILGFAELGFVLWMLIDCCCSKLQKKWMWILVVLLGSITWMLTVTPQQFRFHFNYALFFRYTSLVRYSTGGFQFRLYLPIGALAYIICKKQLPRKEPVQQTEP